MTYSRREERKIKEQTTLRLPIELKEKLEKICVKENRSLSEVIRAVMKQTVSDYEN